MGMAGEGASVGWESGGSKSGNIGGTKMHGEIGGIGEGGEGEGGRGGGGGGGRGCKDREVVRVQTEIGRGCRGEVRGKWWRGYRGRFREEEGCREPLQDWGQGWSEEGMGGGGGHGATGWMRPGGVDGERPRTKTGTEEGLEKGVGRDGE